MGTALFAKRMCVYSRLIWQLFSSNLDYQVFGGLVERLYIDKEDSYRATVI